MYCKQTMKIFPMLLLIAALALSGCSTLIQPVTKSGTASLPVVSVEKGGVENPNIYVKPDEFKDALLKAIAARDEEKLKLWMTEPFLTGAWRADLFDASPADALKWLYASELGPDNSLALVKDADLKALLTGIDPLSIPRAEAGVVEAALVSGWGLDGLDEAVLFIARQPDNSLKWHGWMRIQGGISGARFGGVQAYQNDSLGFRVYVPKGYEINAVSDNNVSIVAPSVEGAGHSGNASLAVEPANGRTAQAAAQQAYDEGIKLLGTTGNVSITAMGIGDTTAYVVSGLPGQDMHRQLFMVHNDQLYHMWFFPEDPQSHISYAQMLNIYAMVTNTFYFIK